jgi:ferredoxin
MTGWQRFEKSELAAVVSALQGQWDVFAPVERDGEFRFRELPSDGEIVIGPRKPLLPLKSLYLPEVEDLFSFTVRGGETRITPAEPIGRQRVVVGALGCDVEALEILDRVFLDEPVDDAYRARREQTTLVALACTGEGPECFCTFAGVNPLQPSGADAMLADIGSAYLLRAVSDKGERVVGALGTLLKEADDGELAELASLAPVTQKSVSFDGVPRDYTELWDLRTWDNFAALCIGCGTCTFVCPTCHCFDVEDEHSGCSGKRFRAWDSCMSSCFTKMGTGENPRGTPRERIRQRFLHKLSYLSLKTGRIACTGCGRCGARCPVGIGIEEVISDLAGVKVSRG